MLKKNLNQRKAGAFLSYIQIVLTTVIQVIYTPFLIRMLGQSEYGLYSLIASIIGYLTILDLGFGNAIIVYTAKYKATSNVEAEKKLHGMFKLIYIIIGLLSMLIGIALFFGADRIFGGSMSGDEIQKAKTMLLILTFNLGVTFGTSIYTSIISAYEKFIFQKILAIINTLLKPALMIPLLLLGYKAIAMTVVLTIVNLIIIISNIYYCKKRLKIDIKFSGFDKKLFKVIFGYSIWIFLGIIVDKINWSIDQFILGAVSGTIAVSIYSVASQINTIFINLSTAISGVMLPKISGLVAKNTDVNRLTNEMIKIGRLQFYIVFLMLSGFVIFGKHFIELWLGPNFNEAYYCILFLSIPLLIPLIQNLGISIRQAMNKHKPATIINLSTAIFNLIITFFLAKKYGPTGAALGTAIGAIIASILLNIYYNNALKLNMKRFWSEILKLSIPYLFFSTLTFFFYNAIQKTTLLIFILGIFLYTICYLFIVYFISMNNYEKSIAKKILNKLHIAKKG